MSFQNVTSLQSVSLSCSNKAKVSKVLKSGSSHCYMQKRLQSELFQWWPKVGRPDVLTLCCFSRSWAGGRQSEWARDSQTPSGRSPAGTARCTWGRFSSGSPHAPRTCSGRSWAGRWPHTTDIASCPCCTRGKRTEEERKRRGEKAHVNKQWSDDVGKPGAQANKEHLSDATWVACCSTNTNKRGLCSRTNTLHMLQCTGLENRSVQQTLMAFMRVWVCWLCFTWDQSRRQFVHHSQMGCGFQLLWAVRWYYPERER